MKNKAFFLCHGRRGLMVATLSWGLSFGAALAHSDGHGPSLDGTGPSGGRLAAVVSAEDADKKKDAQVRFHAELTSVQGRLRVGLLDKVTRAALSITPQTGKVIVLSSAKPRVLIAEPTFGGLLLPPELKREQGNNLEIIFFLPEGKFVSLFPN
jgi:hypothetical protein